MDKMDIEDEPRSASASINTETSRARSASISHILEEVSSVILDQEETASFTGLPTSKQGRVNDSHFFSQFNEDSFLAQHRQKPGVYISGGVAIPPKDELTQLLRGEDHVKVMCLTWNINGRSVASIRSINDLFKKIPSNERPEVFAVALQELPSKIRFHREMIEGIREGIKETHQTFCWVRKWSQLLIVFMKKHLCLYTSRPEYQFVASSKLAKPFKTKGAIGICFRVLQSSFVFISCHFSHGKLRDRILDYKKASTLFNFRNTLRPNSAQREHHSIFNASAVFWFGDLNFRLLERLTTDELAQNFDGNIFIHRQDYEALFAADELRHCMEEGLVFNGFKEAQVLFPPTYKFIVDSLKYAKHRIPSYTDRILYRCLKTDSIKPLQYDIVWSITVSDHKAIYGVFLVKVLECRCSSSTAAKTQLLAIPTGDE